MLTYEHKESILIGAVVVALFSWQISTPYWSFSQKGKNYCKLVYDGWVWNLEATGWRNRDFGPELSFSKNFLARESGTGHHFFGAYPTQVFIAGDRYWIANNAFGVPSLAAHEDDEWGSELRENTMFLFLHSLSQEPVIEIPYFDYGIRQVKYGYIEIEIRGMKTALNNFAICLGYGRMEKDN